MIKIKYNRFETKNSSYLIFYHIHGATFSTGEDLDGLILEGLNVDSLRDERGLKEYIKNRDISIFGGDVFTHRGPHFWALYLATELVPPSFGAMLAKSELKIRKISRRGFVKGLVKVGLGSFLMSGIVMSGLTALTGSPIVAEVAALRLHLLPTPNVELRNAIIARKTEEFIAPLMKKRLGRKPLLGILYGAGHAGIKNNIENKEWRDRTIDLYKRIGYCGIERAELDWVLEERYRRDARTLRIPHYVGHLFET